MWAQISACELSSFLVLAICLNSYWTWCLHGVWLCLTSDKTFQGAEGQTLHLRGGGYTSLKFPTQCLLALLVKGVWRQSRSLEIEACKAVESEVFEYARARKWTVWGTALWQNFGVAESFRLWVEISKSVLGRLRERNLISSALCMTNHFLSHRKQNHYPLQKQRLIPLGKVIVIYCENHT
jgi:hypothetical protein